MLPPGNLISSIYFRSFRFRIPPRPLGAREAWRLRVRRARGRRRRRLRREAAKEKAVSNWRKAATAAKFAALIGGRASFVAPDPSKDELTKIETHGGWDEAGELAWQGISNGGDDDSDGSSDEETHELYDDIYSMLFLSGLRSPTAVYAFLTFSLKMTFFSFLLVDMLKGSDPNNFFNAPAGISTPVRVSQFCLLPFSVAMQEDLIGSIFLFNVHYDEDIQKECPHATRSKWVLSAGLRFVDGMYSLTTSFLLLLTASSVLDLFFNFTALEFIQMVDNVAFELALKGYLNDGIENSARLTTKLTMPRWGRGIWGILDSISFVFIFVMIFITWMVITVKQLRGDFLCQTLSVTFGQDLVINRGDVGQETAFDGLYTKVGSLTIGLRSVYHINRQTANGALKGYFAYCPRRSHWTYTILTEKDPYKLTEDDVCTYDLRSPPAPNSFDITEIGPSEWFYRERGVDKPTRDFNLWCSACESLEDCGRGADLCQAHMCVCKAGYYGVNCEYGPLGGGSI